MTLAVGDTMRKAEQAASDALKDKRLQGFEEEAVTRSTKTEKGPGGSTLSTTTTTTTQKTKGTGHTA